MNERLNKTSICTVIFLDIVGYSKCTDSEQIAQKKQFNRLISEAIKNVAQNDRILLDTGDGAAIALLGAPEEALFIAMTIRDGIHALNEKAKDHLLVRIGINLGPVRVVKDINGRPNIIGDGINVAQRVMSFAEPNQILVSRSYYEITSRLSKEITELFTYSGVKQDKHVREHEVYEIGTYHQAGAIAANLDSDRDSIGLTLNSAALLAAGKRWMPVTVALVMLIILTVMLARGILISDSPTEMALEQQDNSIIGSDSQVLEQEQLAETQKTPTETPSTGVNTEQPIAKVEPKVQEKPKQIKSVQQKPKRDNYEQNNISASANDAAAKSDSTQQDEKSAWETFKESVQKGSSEKVFCSDAERFLKQCE